MRKVYYAHAICLYGQADECKELGCIRKRERWRIEFAQKGREPQHVLDARKWWSARLCFFVPYYHV